MERDVDAIRILWVDPDGLVITTLAAGARARSRRLDGPACAAVGRLEEPFERPGPLDGSGPLDARVHPLVVRLSGLGEGDESERGSRSTRIAEEVGRERHAAVGRPENPGARHGRVDNRRRCGVQIEVGNKAVENGLAIVEGRRVRAEVDARVDGAEDANVRRNQPHVRGGKHDAVDASIVEDAAGVEGGPGLARVGRLVDADAFEEDAATVEEVACPCVDDVRVARIEGHGAHRERQHEVRLGLPGHTSIRALPDAAIVGRDVDCLVGRVPGVDRDVHDFPGVRPRALEDLLSVNAQRGRADLPPLPAHDTAGHRLGLTRRQRNARRGLHLLHLLDRLAPQVQLH